MTFKDEFKNFMRLGNPYTQNIIGGSVLFCTVGIYLALTGLGAGGGKPTAQQVASTTNAVLYALFTCTGFFGGTLLNTIGPKYTLALGAFGYPVYVSGLWYYDSTGNEWFPLLGGAILGISAGWLWTAVGFIQFAYGEEKDKGFYIATQLLMAACGSTVGGLIAFGINFNIITASGVPESVDIAFVVIQMSAVLLALVCVIKPSQVVRKDGRHIAIFKAPNVVEEFTGCLRLLKDPKILMLLLPMFCTEITLSFVPTINAYAFNLRTRSLNNVLYNAIQIPTCLLYSRVLDNTRFRRRVRGMTGLAISSSLIITSWVITLVMLKRYNIENNIPSPNYDWTDPEFAGLTIQYLIFGCLYALHHMLVQWILSSWTNDPTQLARYAGLFKGILSAGLCVGFGLESAGVSYWAQACFQMSLQFISLPILLYLIFKYTKDTNYFIEKNVIPPQHVESEMIAAGKVTREEAHEILEKGRLEKAIVETYNVPETKEVE
ncbi:hypothetical protein BGW37DRAFT_469008 [Umbelopsis sp. PMI_123]|nr:hypothetical protein BGW37DRAFT_469008 [Umbelopsis sp. PMI_123]